MYNEVIKIITYYNFCRLFSVIYDKKNEIKDLHLYPNVLLFYYKSYTSML